MCCFDRLSAVDAGLEAGAPCLEAGGPVPDATNTGSDAPCAALCGAVAGLGTGAGQNRKSRVNLAMSDCVFNSGYPGTSVSRSEL